MNPRSVLRSLVMFGSPLAYIAIGVVHPMELKVGDDPTLYIAIHVVQLFLIWGMAATLWFLTEGIENRAAKIARVAILPYAIAYATLDGIAGLALGATVQAANTAPVADQEAARRLFETLYMDEASVEGIALYLSASLLWLLAAGATALAQRGRAPAAVVATLLVGAAIFAVGHPAPPGPIGMTLFLVGIAWLELKSTAARQPQIPTVPPVAVGVVSR